MRAIFTIPAAATAVLLCSAAAADGLKNEASRLVANQESELIRLANDIWDHPETALEETFSADALADYAEAMGFEVQRGVAGMPTAFVAEYGSGGPVIGLLGEYDALPGLSQKAVPEQAPVREGAPGHGCGHNLFGPASLGAAAALMQLIADGRLEGTVRFYGCPAEERIGGKVYMAREGLFDDLDVCLAWHPSDKTAADTESTLAMVDIAVEFRGKTAHGAMDPWNGRSALDGAELFAHGLNLLREHVKPSVRMHYIIPNGGLAPNIVPGYAKVWGYLRDHTHEGADALLERARAIAEGAGLMAGVESELTVQGGYYEFLVNVEGAKLLHENLRAMQPIEYTEEELEFARRLHASLGMEPKGIQPEVEPLTLPPPPPSEGSTDIGDVSWKVPVIHLSATTAAADIPWHSWAVTACGGTSIGRKGMMFAAGALARTAIDLYTKDDVRKAIRDEFEASVREGNYKPYIPDGPPPAP